MGNHIEQPPLLTNIPPSSNPDKEVAVLAIHGRNQEPEFMQDIANQLGWQNSSMIFPRAAERTWYPNKFMAPIELNKTQLNEALKTIKKYHNQLNQYGFRDEQIILMGFSQGACLLSQYALLNPRKYKAIFILTGGYLGEENIDWDFKGDFSQTPVLVTTSKIDEWVPHSRAQETAKAFDRLNANVNYKLFEDRPHEVSKEEINIISSCINN